MGQISRIIITTAITITKRPKVRADASLFPATKASLITEQIDQSPPMKKLPRWMALAAIFIAVLIALPPAFAMDIFERVITTQTQFIRHEATEYQRKVAEANARAYMAAQLRAHHRASTAKTTTTPKPGKSGTTAKTKSKEDAQEMAAVKKTLPRYIAVDTPKDKRSAPGTKKDVMIWDTQSEALVGNNVYDVANPPAIGATAKFDTYSAQYVGAGL
jgi:hypothetical protein